MLILVRHGRTEANAAGLLLGRSDPPLDAVGTRQATSVAAALGRRDRVVAGPLRRTRATADALGDDVDIDDRWIEMSYGDWEQRPLRDVPPSTWREWMADPDFRPPGGESVAEVGLRVRAACDELLVEAADHDVVVVSHVSPIKAAVAWALDVPDEVIWHLFVRPASITRIAVTGSRTVLHSFNETAHLGTVSDT
ncbi:MAG: histidine phosphatase family protein [Actinobacteria bacterium]|nr:histidine phosphatase family protein [Actinomycetota bacterium]